MRPTRTSDTAGLRALLHRLSADDVRMRFFQTLKSLTDQAAQHLERTGDAVTVGPADDGLREVTIRFAEAPKAAGECEELTSGLRAGTPRV